MVTLNPGLRRTPSGAAPGFPFKQLDRAVLTESPSPCPHCVAGPFAGQSYEAELAAKVLELRRELGTSPRLAQAVVLDQVKLQASPLREGYRGTVKLVFGWDRAQRRARLGLYAEGSHQLIGVEHCPEHHPAMAPVLDFICEAVVRLGLPVYQESRRNGFLRHLLLRVLPDGRMLACFVTPHAEGGWQDKLLQLAEELRQAFPQVRSISQNLNPGTGNAVLGSITQEVAGQWSVPCAFLERPVAVTGTCFMQANLGLFRIILAGLRTWVEGFGSDCRVADLYCGCGAIGLSVTHKQPLFLLEGDHASQLPLMEAARADGREEILVTRGRVQDCLTSLELFEPELVLVDPPRKGLDPALVEALGQLKPRALAYLSCNPFTLARDLDQLLSQGGWRVEALQGFDMMPGTQRMEALALLQRG